MTVQWIGLSLNRIRVLCFRSGQSSNGGPACSWQHRYWHRRTDPDGAQLRRPLPLPLSSETQQGKDQKGHSQRRFFHHSISDSNSATNR